MISLIKSDLDSIYDKVIKACRKGEFLYLIYSNKKVKKEIKKALKSFKIPFKRGIYMWKGIIIISSSISDEHKSYFDKIYKVV